MITKDRIRDSFESESDRLFHTINEIFGDRYEVKVKRSNGFGFSIFITIYGKSPINNIPQNCPTFTQLIMNLSDTYNQWSDCKKLSWDAHYIPRQLKYRKISSPVSFEDVNTKLCSWLRNNKTTYDKLIA